MGRRILVVEDDASLAQSIVEGLTEEGFAVARAADGDSARDTLRSGGWDLVILDWWLPGTDGLEILAEHRGLGGDTPVLFLTARDAVSDRVRGLDAGADDYLCKPFSFDELLARARALMRRETRRTPRILTYRDVRLDLVTRRAERAGRPLNLTAKELSLLALFLDHPGQILSRSRIYAQVWGEEYDFVSNTLDVHIMELRRALEVLGPRLIRTIRGQGYLLGDANDLSAKGGS